MPSKTQKVTELNSYRGNGTVTDVTTVRDTEEGTTHYVAKVEQNRREWKKPQVLLFETENRELADALKDTEGRVAVTGHLGNGDDWHVPMVADGFELLPAGKVELENVGEIIGERGDLKRVKGLFLSDLFLDVNGEQVCVKIYDEDEDDELLEIVEGIKKGEKVKVTYRLHTHSYNGKDYTRVIGTAVEVIS